MITVRYATEDDLPAIIEIYKKAIPPGRATADTKPITVAERLDWFRKFAFLPQLGCPHEVDFKW